MIYFEFKHLIRDYFRTLNLKIGMFDLGIPFVLGVISFCVVFWWRRCIPDLSSSLITLLGIFIGFSIAMLTIITTSSNRNVNEIKRRDTDLVLDGVKVTLYKLFIINIGYSIIVETLFLVATLFLSVVITINNVYSLSISIFFITHILFVNLRTVTNLYFIETADNL